jgi:hypothetical protein
MKLFSDNHFSSFNWKSIFSGTMAVLNLTVGEMCLMRAVKDVYLASKKVIITHLDGGLTANPLYTEALFFAFIGLTAFISGCYILCRDHNHILNGIGEFIRGLFVKNEVQG